MLTVAAAAEIDEESIGYLTQPVEIPRWESKFQQRYAFLAELNDEDHVWAGCHAGHIYQFQQAIAALGEDDPGRTA